MATVTETETETETETAMVTADRTDIAEMESATAPAMKKAPLT